MRRGGALITARLAVEQNREAFAVPGSVHSPASAGVNRLIQKGEAKLVQRVEDILEELDMASEAMPAPMKDIPILSPEEQVLCQALSTTTGPLHINTLCLSAGMDPATALVHLLDLELKGIVKQLAGKQFFLGLLRWGCKEDAWIIPIFHGQIPSRNDKTRSSIVFRNSLAISKQEIVEGKI